MERLQSEGGWQLCLLREEYTPLDAAKYKRRSRGSKQLDVKVEMSDVGVLGVESLEDHLTKLKGEDFGEEGKSGKQETERQSRQEAPVVNEQDDTPIEEWKDVDTATLRIATWNANPLHNVLTKAPDKLLLLVEEQRPDVICLPEIRVKPEDLEKERYKETMYYVFEEYTGIFAFLEKPEYSGVATFVRNDTKERLGRITEVFKKIPGGGILETWERRALITTCGCGLAIVS
ncbi:hypothetical protein HDV00_011213, partial [Rhizophlyctis rosea]